MAKAAAAGGVWHRAGGISSIMDLAWRYQRIYVCCSLAGSQKSLAAINISNEEKYHP
jgi:hypothetical protein